jgi:hypothetical protein
MAASSAIPPDIRSLSFPFDLSGVDTASSDLTARSGFVA